MPEFITFEALDFLDPAHKLLKVIYNLHQIVAVVQMSVDGQTILAITTTNQPNAAAFIDEKGELFARIANALEL